MNPGRCWALALITCREGIRNRSLYGIFLVSLFILGLNIAVAGFFMRDIGKVSVDMNLSALSLAGLLLVFFVGLNLMAKDIDRKTIHLVLSKPLTRVEYIWGKFLGILLFVAASLGLLLVFSCGTLAVLGNVYGDYFREFSWVIYLTAALFILLKLGVLSAVVVFFSSLTSNSFITLIFSVCTFVIGAAIEEVVFYLESGFAAGELPLSALWLKVLQVVSYAIPNLSAFDFKIEAAHGLVIHGSRLLLTLGYGVSYIAVLLLLASMIFSRREFN